MVSFTLVDDVSDDAVLDNTAIYSHSIFARETFVSFARVFGDHQAGACTWA